MPTDAEVYRLAEHIYSFLAPNNPHGPRSDLYYGHTYTARENELARQIALSVLEEGYKPPPAPEPKAKVEFRNLPLGALWRWVGYRGGPLVKITPDRYYCPAFEGSPDRVIQIDSAEVNWSGKIERVDIDGEPIQ